MDYIYLKHLPIPNATEQEQQKLANLAQKMIDTNVALQKIGLQATEKTMLQRQLESTDKLIDKMVYELYELTQDEIDIVENENNK